LILFLLCASFATAQVTIGNNLQMTMNGSLGVGYSSGFGNFGRSSHGLGFGFDGLLNGFYYNPKFINFDVRPYYNRAQANSDLQSIVQQSGIGGSVNFFSNSPYPGSVSVGRDYSMNSEFQFAGVPSIVADTTSNSLGITWNLLLPHKPTLTATWGMSDSDSAITGTTMDSTSSNRTLSLGSTYKWDGWSMFASLAHYNANYNLPEVITGLPESLSSSGTFLSFTTQHKIPLDGSISLGWSHGSGENNQGDHNSGSSYSVGVGITPWQRLGLATSFSYSSNASQYFAYTTLGSNSTGIPLVSNNAKLLFSSSSASIYLGHGFSVIGHVTWREEDFGYATFSETQYGGTVSWRYNKRWLEGFYFAVGAVDTANQGGNGGTGLNATVGLDRKFHRWDVSADFNYLHDLQTYYGLINTSYMNYGGSVRRKLNPETYLSLFTRETHSGLVTQSGTGNKSSSYGASLSWRGYGVTGNYSSASGTAILSATGTLVPVPGAPLFTPEYLYFNAKAWGVSANKLFFRRLAISAAYTQVASDSQRLGINNSNYGDRWGATASYHFRKLNFQGGFTQVNQLFKVTPLVGAPVPARVVNTYFVSVSRWFNLF
jgi:hypothetical protein